MKRLFLTGDTRNRASSQSLFVPVYNLIKESNDIDLIEVNGREFYGDNFKKDIISGNSNTIKKVSKNLDVSFINDTYDTIFIENIYPFWNEDWLKIKARKFLIMGDLQNFVPNKGKFGHMLPVIINRIDLSGILTKYILFWEKEFSSINIPVIWWPHSVDTTIFKDYGLKKEYGLFSSGVIKPSVYPIREKLHNLFNGKKYYKRIERPNNKNTNSWPIGSDYSKEINKSKISISCTSIYKYSVAKLFEIPASNSVLFCDYTDEMVKLGFIPNVNFLKILDNNIVEFVEDMLNSPLLDEICRNGYNFVKEKHNTMERIKTLLEI